jgi:hypothetical protein
LSGKSMSFPKTKEPEKNKGIIYLTPVKDEK